MSASPFQPGDIVIVIQNTDSIGRAYYGVLARTIESKQFTTYVEILRHKDHPASVGLTIGFASKGLALAKLNNLEKALYLKF